MNTLLPNRFSGFSRQIHNAFRHYASKATGRALLSVPKAEIADGKILYLLISVYIHGETLFARTILRGRQTSGKPHTSIYEKFKREMEKKGLCTRALGGGMMNVDEKACKIKIFGMCKTFGRANHYKARSILKSMGKYKHFKITVKK